MAARGRMICMVSIILKARMLGGRRKEKMLTPIQFPLRLRTRLGRVWNKSKRENLVFKPWSVHTYHYIWSRCDFLYLRSWEGSLRCAKTAVYVFGTHGCPTFSASTRDLRLQHSTWQIWAATSCGRSEACFLFNGIKIYLFINMTFYLHALHTEQHLKKGAVERCSTVGEE